MPEDLFDHHNCQSVLAHVDNIHEEGNLQDVIGGECFPGQLAWLYAWIIKFKSRILAIASKTSVAESYKKGKIMHTQHIQHL